MTTILFCPNVSLAQYEIQAADWNNVNKRVHLITSNSNMSGYAQYRSLDNDRLYFANNGAWEYSIRPNIKKFVKDAEAASTGIDKSLGELASIADRLSEADDAMSAKLEEKFRAQLSKCKIAVNNVHLPLVDILKNLVVFRDVNDSFDYQYKTKYNSQTILPTISENANSIDKIRGVTDALESDLSSLMEILNELDNADRILIGYKTGSAHSSWQNIMKGLKGYGGAIEGDGWDVNYVEYGGGSFTQIDDDYWVGEGINPGTYVEYSRDAWSVYMYDTTKVYYIVLDQHTKKIRYKKGLNGNYNDLYSIQDTRYNMNGKLLEGLVYLVKGKPLRQIVKVGDTWVESDIHTAANKIVFVETGRDDWSVYLWDKSRNVRLGLDMYRMMVTYSDSNASKRDVYKIAYGY